MSRRLTAAALACERLVLPANISFEKSLLGAILLDGTIPVEAAGLMVEDFFPDQHRRVYACMLGLNEDGIPIDSALLTEALRCRKELEAVGGAAYISSLTEGVPKRSNCKFYIDEIRSKAVLRKLARGGELLQLAACDTDADPCSLISRVTDLAEQCRKQLSTGGIHRLADLTPYGNLTWRQQSRYSRACSMCIGELHEQA